MFSYEPAVKPINKDLANGPMAYDNEHLDDLVDMLEKANPADGRDPDAHAGSCRPSRTSCRCSASPAASSPSRRPNSGPSERTVERASNGANIMKPAANPPGRPARSGSQWRGLACRPAG